MVGSEVSTPRVPFPAQYSNYGATPTVGRDNWKPISEAIVEAERHGGAVLIPPGRWTVSRPSGPSVADRGRWSSASCLAATSDFVGSGVVDT